MKVSIIHIYIIIFILGELNLCHSASHHVEQNRFKQRVWVQGARPEEEEIFQFTMVQVPVTLSACFSLAVISDTSGGFNRLLLLVIESRRLMGWLLADREPNK